MNAFSDPDGPRVSDVDFAKQGGLVPAVVQDARTGRVLMVGYQDEGALRATLDSGQATFFSRSRGERWVKGATSGNTLTVTAVHLDCDSDTVLILAEPAGPTCHTGATSCFGEVAGSPPAAGAFLTELDTLVGDRHTDRPSGSYTTELFEAGTRRIAQKVGEEGVEAALAAVAQDDEALSGEAADLVYHLLVLLHSRGLAWSDVEQVLRDRHR